VLRLEIRHDANTRNYTGFVPKKGEQMTDAVDEPEYESKGINAIAAGEK
jgi:hypothetical protein